MELAEIIEEVFNLKRDEQKDDISFASLDEWDSMTHMLFITQIEENFSVELTGDEIADIKTIGDLKIVLNSKNVTV